MFWRLEIKKAKEKKLFGLTYPRRVNVSQHQDTVLTIITIVIILVRFVVQSLLDS